MVRSPLTQTQLASGKRLGSFLREARADRPLVEVAREAGMSPETLRKIETGRLPSPAFGTIVRLSAVLDLEIQALADVWSSDQLIQSVL